MRKLFKTIAALVLSLTLCVSALGGCALVSTDNEADMNQVVATVQIDKNANKDEILKKDMIMAYMNYGYMYEQYYGYTREKTFNLIITNLINTRVHLQNAMKSINGSYADVNSEFYGLFVDTNNTNVYDVERYLEGAPTDTTPMSADILDATYKAYKDMNELIESYEDHDHGDKVGDTMIETVRTAPTDATAAEEEVTDTEKQDYINAGIGKDASKKAFNKVINLLEDNGLLGDYKGGDFTDTDYYKETLNSYYENRLLEIYENAVKTHARKIIEFSDLNDAFVKEYKKQQNWNNAEFITALGSASATAPILYANNGTYGFVYNLLLGANEKQTAEIGKIDTENKNLSTTARAEKRKAILDKTIVKDLRSTWVLSGYDFDFANKTFTGDYSFSTNGIPFQGEVVHLNAGDEDEHEYKAEYGVKSVEEFTLNSFIEKMETWVYGETKTGEVVTNPSVYKKVNATTANAEYDKIIQDLLFAFSTDSGSLNTYKGYAIKPTPDGSETEEYMQEFADAGRELLNMGGKSYVMVATDYGYHVMFFSEVYEVGSTFVTPAQEVDYLEAYLDAEFGAKDWGTTEFNSLVENFDDYEDTKNYMYYLYNNIASTFVNKALNDKNNKVLMDYVYSDNGAVVKYPERYQDLLDA